MILTLSQYNFKACNVDNIQRYTLMEFPLCLEMEFYSLTGSFVSLITYFDAVKQPAFISN